MKWQNAMLKDLLRLEKLEKERADIIKILKPEWPDPASYEKCYLPGYKLARDRIFERLGEKNS